MELKDIKEGTLQKLIDMHRSEAWYPYNREIEDELKKRFADFMKKKAVKIMVEKGDCDDFEQYTMLAYLEMKGDNSMPTYLFWLSQNFFELMVKWLEEK